MTVWIDGTWRTRETATVSVFDHSFLYGDGIFEGIRVYRGEIFRLKAHLKRLYDGAKALLLPVPYAPEDLGKILKEAVKKDGLSNGYIRLVITRGQGPLGMDPFTCSKPSTIVIVDSIRLYPEEYYQKGIPVISSAFRRNSPDSLDPRIKSLNYLNNILAKMQARQAGAQEAILLNHQGHIAECTGDNLIVVKDGQLKVPRGWHGALEGITLDAVLEIARSLDLPVSDATLTLYDLYTADELMLTGTAAEIVPVSTVDGRELSKNRPIFDRLNAEFHRRIQEDSAFILG